MAKPLEPDDVARRLQSLPGWELSSAGDEIRKTFKFANYYETMAFVNAIAYVAHKADHHPDLEVGYNKCAVHYSTHDVGGLSDADFLSAAKVDALQGK